MTNETELTVAEQISCIIDAWCMDKNIPWDDDERITRFTYLGRQFDVDYGPCFKSGEPVVIISDICNHGITVYFDSEHQGMRDFEKKFKEIFY